MGIFKWFSSGSDSCDCGASTVPAVTRNPNPDPMFFIVKNCKKVENHYVSQIQYPNCTNFEGNKILVTTYDPRNRIKIDPHFFPDSGLIARFEPTKAGAEAAVKLAKIL